MKSKTQIKAIKAKTGVTKSGRKYTITYAECPYIGCEFFSKEFGNKGRDKVIDHIHEKHQ